MLAETDTAGNADEILSTCMDTVKDLSQTLLASQDRSPEVQAALDAAQDGEELLILFQLERGEDAAVDAVTLLLQLKREIADGIDQ